MNLDQQQPFQSNPEWFQAFIDNSDNKPTIQAAILNYLKQKFTDLWQNKIINPAYHTSLLYVGAGNGGLEITLTKALVQARGTQDGLTIYCVDPSSVLRDKFLIAAQSQEYFILDSSL